MSGFGTTVATTVVAATTVPSINASEYQSSVARVISDKVITVYILSLVTIISIFLFAFCCCYVFIKCNKFGTKNRGTQTESPFIPVYKEFSFSCSGLRDTEI